MATLARFAMASTQLPADRMSLASGTRCRIASSLRICRPTDLWKRRAFGCSRVGRIKGALRSLGFPCLAGTLIAFGWLYVCGTLISVFGLSLTKRLALVQRETLLRIGVCISGGLRPILTQLSGSSAFH